ncbi:hypothetical protein ACP70R_013673 [Stipagrostis hirtigluma subsp. patula]
MSGPRGLVAAAVPAAVPPRARCTPPPGKSAGGVSLAVPAAAAASLSLVLWSTPVNAGILSGSTGLEAVPGPELPRVEFLEKWNAENQKKYAEFDSRFKNSKVLKELLERNERQIQDKYCLRGAEWGVGDCSTEGMSDQEREDFISELKKRTGAE